MALFGPVNLREFLIKAFGPLFVSSCLQPHAVIKPVAMMRLFGNSLGLSIVGTLLVYASVSVCRLAVIPGFCMPSCSYSGL